MEVSRNTDQDSQLLRRGLSSWRIHRSPPVRDICSPPCERKASTTLRSPARSGATAQPSAVRSDEIAHASATTAPVRRRSAPRGADPAPAATAASRPATRARVEELLCRQWSPEQVSGHLASVGQLTISHETIYRHIWRDKRAG